uniref:WD40-like protein n=1 Tax=Acrobeloides nanus TaxID=290746 RepID=A0A914DKE9_9BILA
MEINLLFILFLLQFLPFLYGRLKFPGEIRLKNVRQLTFGGENSGSRFSPDGRWLVFQASGLETYGTKCNQIYRLDLSHLDKRPFRLSTGLGIANSPSFYPNSQDLIYSSTFLKHGLSKDDTSVDSCPKSICEQERTRFDLTLRRICQDHSNLLEIHPEFDIFKINRLGNLQTQLTTSDFYEAESIVSPDGKWVVYSDYRPSGFRLRIMNATDSSGKRTLTNESFGYIGGASFSPDGTKIVFYASMPNRSAELESSKYRNLLRYNLVDMNLIKTKLFVINIDGTGLKEFNQLLRPSFALIFMNDGKLIFAYKNSTSSEKNYDLYAAGENGNNLERITYNPNGFDSYPAFDPKTSRLVWSSSRNATRPGEINLFIADFVDSNSKNYAFRKKISKSRRPNSSKDFLRSLNTFSTHANKLHFDNEKHLKNVQQLTFGGQNAEGYFSFQDDGIVLQAAGLERYGTSCDQIYRLAFTPTPTNETILQRLSTGLGVCTCSYLFPDGKHSIHAATFKYANFTPGKLDTCPPKKCASEEAKTDPILKELCNTSYTWDLFPQYDIFKVNEYGNLVAQLTNTWGYDAEGAISPDGKSIVFTSLRTGDPEIWIMNSDGSNPRQLTFDLGYDGGPFFSPDGTKIGFRASRPKTDKEINKYKTLLSYSLVEPLAMELFTINIDGTGLRQITHLGGSNWAPFYLDDNKRIVFSTNFNATGHFGSFDLYVINEDESGLERVTFNENGFDAFPMMSHNGKKLIWGSSRNGKGPMDLNLFLADWLEK